ncbi:MAG: Smr/MutS family protein, partial [Gammaproteobacteria bacterium]|nr:Smr/MutS family protein [Gammaproteobacteria bacterium]
GVHRLDDERAPAYRRHGKRHARPAGRTPAVEPPPEPDAGAAHPQERDASQLFVRPGLQHKHLRKLRRGRLEIEAEADLHGMRARQADGVLHAFLDECRRRRLRCVRVIHGKGRGSHGGQAVLKWEVDRWLRQHDAVMAFCTAQPRDGGTGALYVLLRG